MKTNIKKFKQGEYLLRQNEYSSHMFVINSGRIRVFREEGNHVTYHNDVGEGATCGEISLIDPGPRSASAVALEDVEARVIYPEDLTEANKNCPEWLQSLARTLAMRTRTVLSSIERNPDEFIKNSIISLLVYLSVARGETLTFDKNELLSECAEILRLSTSDLEKHLAELESRGHLEINEVEVNLKDIDKLEAYSREILKNLKDTHLKIFKP